MPRWDPSAFALQFEDTRGSLTMQAHVSPSVFEASRLKPHPLPGGNSQAYCIARLGASGCPGGTNGMTSKPELPLQAASCRSRVWLGGLERGNTCAAVVGDAQSLFASAMVSISEDWNSTNAVGFGDSVEKLVQGNAVSLIRIQ